MIKQSKPDKVFSFVNGAILIAITLVVLYPLIYVVSCSFSSPQAVTAGKVFLLPVDFSVVGYEAIFKNAQIWTGYRNSIFYAVVGTFINIVITLMAAYPLSRKDFFGRGPIMLLFTFTMIFSGGMIPTYLTVQALGLVDTVWAMIIPSALGVWYMIIARTYFQTTIPGELQEAAELDGCSDIQLIFKVILPLSKPIIAVLTLFYAIQHWNSYFDALIYLRSDDLYPLQIILRNILVQNQVDASMIADVSQIERREGLAELLKYSLIVVASFPALLIYPFVQKHFVKGMMIGSVKG